MILLFDSKSSKAAASNRNSNVKNHPVENSGILAMSMNDAKSLLTMGEYDTYVFSNPAAVDYSMYSSSDYTPSEGGYTSEYSTASAFLGDGGFSTGSYECGSSSYSGSSCSSFASVC